MEYLISIIFGYLIGSFPTAFIVLKKKRGIDIRNAGSGNVGTLNSYEVTNSKKIGIAVLVVDMFKGIVSVVFIKMIFDEQFILPALSLLFAVFGHCYSIWLKFKGGRGLATAAGGALVLSPIILVIWGTSWIIVQKWKKDIHIANISATILTLSSAIIFSQYLNVISFLPAETSFIYGFSISLLMLIILSKHWQPFLEIMKRNNR
ncbi:MAG: glycerol-3-phosphate acyltransferase [Ignavibacteriales bacterium]|nr:glycerol-3-phosphate acyltransferase [Ignavibacteriales bacterium]